MERPLGEEFEMDGKKLRVDKSQSASCEGCVLEMTDCFRKLDMEETYGLCMGDTREDRTDVIFREVSECGQ